MSRCGPRRAVRQEAQRSMSGSKRTPLARPAKTKFTTEMLDLYRRGCKLRDAGHADTDDESKQHAEFNAIAKRLEWVLLKRAPHEVSVFDDLSGDPPLYMQRRNTPARPDFNGWYSGRALQQALNAALDAQRIDGVRKTPSIVAE